MVSFGDFPPNTDVFEAIRIMALHWHISCSILSYEKEI